MPHVRTLGGFRSQSTLARERFEVCRRKPGKNLALLADPKLDVSKLDLNGTHDAKASIEG